MLGWTVNGRNGKWASPVFYNNIRDLKIIFAEFFNNVMFDIVFNNDRRITVGCAIRVHCIIKGKFRNAEMTFIYL
jgi:hypothetical protein